MSYDETWVPPSDQSEIFSKGPDYQYWVSLYYSVLLLIGGDVWPDSVMHCCFSSLLILIGAIITAVMFGNMAVLMSNLNMRQTKF